ncbi:uncharacterized protein LOC103705005 [Phoenix dactylifera]|uniref:Uncharacterized protein LOC103705005 n=1 Tax=Phoenix dactylifera TaxID=42345 RepID=A0A8B7BWG9_PHODC|nr:uncharacterized protein LOC103705005 [Phoenix dactylifera]
MAQRKEKSNLRGESAKETLSKREASSPGSRILRESAKETPSKREASSAGGKILRESAKETPSKREASHSHVPEVEPVAHKVPKLGAESIHKGGSSTATGELHVVDESDGTRWTIQDGTVIDLLKRYMSSPDQKTKDEIVERLESYVASLTENSRTSQESKNSSNRRSSHQPLMPKAADLAKIAENLQKLKLDENPQVLMSSTKIQASQSDKQFQDPKKGGTKGDLEGNRMDVDKKSSHQPSIPGSSRLPRDNK